MLSAVNLVCTIVSLAVAIEPPTPEERVAVATSETNVSLGETLEEGSPPTEAVEEFRRGRILFEAADYRAAGQAFARAYALHPSPDLQYNIAQCHMRLEEYEEAIPAFEAYLEGKGNPPDAADVRVQIAEARQRIAERKGALARLEKAARVADPKPRTAATDPVPGDVSDAPAEGRERTLVIAGATVFGVGLAATAGSVTALALAIDDNNGRIRKINAGNPEGLTFDRAQDLERDNQRLETGQYVAIGIGAAVTLTGLVVMSVGLARRAERRRASASLSPSVMPQAYGVAVSGAF